MVEISDADYQLLELQKKVLGGPNRIEMLRHMKQADPNVPIAELVLEDRIAARISPLEEENKKLREEIERRAVMDGLKEKRQSTERLLQSKGLTAKVSDVEKLMVDKGLSSHETAIEFLEMNNKISAPKAGPSWDNRVRSHEASAEIAKDPAGWARRMAAETIDQMNGVTR